MNTTTPLQPTLWRTCRVLANRTRLEMFRLLLRDPGQTVSEVARQLRKPLSLTSEYLRALESRGLLTARRVGRWVQYRPSPPTNPNVSGMVAALRATFQRESSAIDIIFRLATAFTHPRRVEMFRVIQTRPHTLEQLQASTRIPGWALLRHLKKLQARGFVTERGGLYTVIKRADALGQELARLTAR